VDLAEIVQAAVDECAPFAASREVALRFDRAEARFFMLGDAQRLTQIMSNLLGNAIKFTPSGGAVDVRLERTDGWARIRVSDTGVGMTPEELERIFERFWQAQRATTRTHGGLGLGLALTKYVIDQHEGEIRAESDGPNRGSTFTVRLPMLALAPAGEVPAPAPGAPRQALHGISVLLVEDEADARDAVAAMLEHAGATVIVASSVREALAACERQAVDVVVTDLGMPDEDGFALARAVRAQDGHRNTETPLVALTGFVGTQDRSAVREAGFVMHLEKPVDFEALIEGLRAVTGRRA
jgi:CheY-like chemotaxis protein/anti-sigma regulatory factor (Ser/Thr protein kinase)